MSSVTTTNRLAVPADFHGRALAASRGCEPFCEKWQNTTHDVYDLLVKLSGQIRRWDIMTEAEGEAEVDASARAGELQVSRFEMEGDVCWSISIVLDDGFQY